MLVLRPTGAPTAAGCRYFSRLPSRHTLPGRFLPPHKCQREHPKVKINCRCQFLRLWIGAGINPPLRMKRLSPLALLTGMMAEWPIKPPK